VYLGSAFHKAGEPDHFLPLSILVDDIIFYFFHDYSLCLSSTGGRVSNSVTATESPMKTILCFPYTCLACFLSYDDSLPQFCVIVSPLSEDDPLSLDTAI